jgi:site-specific recombinase XerD/transcription elongation factor Elf1
MSEIDWKRDFQGEFVCPNCEALGIIPITTQFKIGKLVKTLFRCPFCQKSVFNSCEINISAVADPINIGLTWYTGYKIKDFVCPKCETRNIFFRRFKKDGKKIFYCRNCNNTVLDCITLIRPVVSKYSQAISSVEAFDFAKDEWDLRAINSYYDAQDLARSIINFKSITLEWFQKAVKKYILFLVKSGQSFKTIASQLSALRIFSNYLVQSSIENFNQINRSLMINYFHQLRNLNKTHLGCLRKFFEIGTAKKWLTVEQDLIRSVDYPKQHRSNPDPLSTVVREQIEQKLYKLPDPIARMWLVCFFAAMRPSELALLKKNCLAQEGGFWKLVWGRKKTDDFHEIPITRTIAKIVQEQQEYIEKLWGKEWEYLFCNYYGKSNTLSQLNLKPVKKVIPSDSNNNPLTRAIQALIKSENILDENGQLAKFNPKILRTTRLTQLFEQGHDLTVVSSWAGHKHLVTTSTYYTEVSCELIERETGHIQKALVNINGQSLSYESLPKSFWENPQAHKLELAGTHINTPITGYCGLPLDEECTKFRACFTCLCFVPVPEKLPEYIKTRDELRGKQIKALANGHDVLVEQFGRQADQLDKIIASLQEAA